MEEKAVSLRIPATTIIKILFTLVIVHILLTLMPIFLLLFLAILIAVTLAPVLYWTEKKGTPKWVAIAGIALLMVITVVGFAYFVGVPLGNEISSFVTGLPKLKEQIAAQFPPGAPLHQMVTRLMKSPMINNPEGWMDHFFSVSQIAFGGLSAGFLILILSIYLLIDGRKTYLWLSAFFSHSIKAKLDQTSEEISSVVFAYVAGQVITSALSSIYVFLVLTLLHVPLALVLAVIAGVFDVLPILGFFLAVVPAMLAAMHVSSTTALYVLLLYIFYHGVENYFIVPKVYGNRLRVSTLVVLLTLLAGGALAGIAGAVAVLPIIASYPIIERVWLKEYLGSGVVQEHKAVEESKNI